MTIKVLVVDDSAVMRTVVSRTLNQAGLQGAEYRFAANGAEALAAVRACPDLGLIVTDRHMPMMDGVAFIRELRKDPSARGIPVLVISTEGNVDRVTEAREAGANAYVTKPFELEAVKKALREILSL